MARTVLALTHSVPFPTEPVLKNVGNYIRRIATFMSSVASGARNGTALEVLSGAAAGTGTITLASCAAGTVVRINGVDFRAISGSSNVVANREFGIGGTDTADAAALAAVINATTDTRIAGVVTATSALGVVTLVPVTAGAASNAISIEIAGILANGTITAASVQAADTITVNGTTLTSRQEMARGTIALSSVAAGQTVTIQGVVFTAIAGSTSSGRQFAIGGTDTQDGDELAACINADPAVSDYVTAHNAAGTVTLRAILSGTGGNAYTLAKSGAGITISGATLSGGQATSATTWDYGNTDTQAATEMARAINANTTIAASATATSSAAVVTVRATASGLLGNAVTLASSDNGRLAVTGARLTGGTVAAHEGVQASGTLTFSSSSGTVGGVINGVSVTVSFSVDDDTTAALVAAAINNSTNALVRGLVTATVATNVVTVTAVRGGTAGNNITFAATGTGVTASGSGRLASGAVPATVVRSGAQLTGGSNGTRLAYTI